MFKKTIYFLLTLFLCWAAARFSHHQTKGFRLSKLQRNTSPTLYPHEPCSLIPTGAKFHYLGRGKQSFSFLSEDGTTVLKLFNNQYQNRLFWLNHLPSLVFLHQWKEQRIGYNQAKWAQAFNSYALAYEKLKEESALLYFHPNECTQCPSVTLIDPLRIEHRVDLSKHAFVLQKKALLPYYYIDKCCKENDLEKGKQALFSLISLLKKKMDLGIADNDPLIRANIGYCDEKAVQIDLGPLSIDTSVQDPAWQKKELHTITLPLKHWLENHHQELVVHLDEAIENL